MHWDDLDGRLKQLYYNIVTSVSSTVSMNKAAEAYEKAWEIMSEINDILKQQSK